MSDGEIIPNVEGSKIVVSAPVVVRDPEIDTRIATARQYPRSVAASLKTALGMATINEDVAGGCWYSLPRDGKQIEGPSVRLAEIMLSSWGNIDAGARVVEIGDQFLTAEGFCWDMEKNVRIAVQVRRRITTKNGRRYSEDMIGTTANAACSIALRNALFRVVPRVFTDQILAEARKVAVGDAKTIVARRDAMFAYFAKLGVDEPRLLASVRRHGREDVTIEDLAQLKGMATAIREGESTIEELFAAPEPQTAAAPRKGVAGLKATLAASEKPVQAEALDLDYEALAAILSDANGRPVDATGARATVHLATGNGARSEAEAYAMVRDDAEERIASREVES